MTAARRVHFLAGPIVRPVVDDEMLPASKVWRCTESIALDSSGADSLVGRDAATVAFMVVARLSEGKKRVSVVFVVPVIL